MNTIPCGECTQYYPVMVGGGMKGSPEQREWSRGHCLAKSVYSAKKAGRSVLPPKARIEDLPDGQHKITLVKKNQIVPGCTHVRKEK